LAEDAVPKGLAMLIRSEKYGVQGGAANAPEGRLGGLRLGTQGLRDHQNPSALEQQRTTDKEFSK
jgi:hypothetical protein